MTDPLTLRLRQPDQRSCGAASMRMARLLSFGLSTTAADFRTDVLALHRRLTGAHDARHRLQVPWSRAVGTPPWAVAHELSDIVGVPYRTSLTTSADRARAPLSDRQRVAALYVGSRWLPRHVVLVLPGTPLRCYEPASGWVLPVDLTGLHLAGWRQPWFVVHAR